MKKARLRVGIIGAGNISGSHALAYRCLPQLAELIAVADVDQARSAAFKRNHGCQYAFIDYKDLLNRADIDVVSICTPPHLHKQIIIDSLDAGKHILCEKPIARTLEDVDGVQQAVERNPQLKMSVVHQYRCDPTYRRIRDLVQDGSLGRISMASVRVRAQRTAAYYASSHDRGSWSVDGGGVLINQAIHQLDLLVAFLGSPVEVSALMRTFTQPTEAEDTLVAWLRFESGTLAIIDCTVCAHDEWFTIELLGENAQARMRGTPDLRQCEWSIESTSVAVKQALRSTSARRYPDRPSGPRRSTELAQKLACKLRSQTWLPPLHWGHTPYVKDFLESITLSHPVPVPANEARRSLELAIAIYSSALIRKPVRIPMTKDCTFYTGISLNKIAAYSNGTEAQSPFPGVES